MSSHETSPPKCVLAAGTVPPDFTLHATPDQTLSRGELRGKPVILAFYPADWSPVCGDQMALYNEVLPEFERYGAQLLGISVDGEWSHAAFADFEPKGAVARRYGVYRRSGGISERALFVIDGEGVVSWRFVSAIDVNPGADGILT